jgi:hypothetical protein
MLAFIAFDHRQNQGDRVRFIEEKHACREAFDVEHWSALPRTPRDDWDKMVHSYIGRCAFMVVLVAEGMDLTQVENEILEAKRCNVPFFGVYVEGTSNGSPLPNGLAANRMASWDWDRIAAAIDQVTKEGKHHVFR